MAASIHSAAKRMLLFADATEPDLLEVVKTFITDRGFWHEKTAGRDTPAVESAPDLQQTVLSGLAAKFGIRTLLAHDQALKLLTQFQEDPAWLTPPPPPRWTAPRRERRRHTHPPPAAPPHQATRQATPRPRPRLAIECLLSFLNGHFRARQ